MIVAYDQQNVRSGVNEANLGLYTWNGTAWQKEPTSRADVATKRVYATPTHLSQWAILAPAMRHMYLPRVVK